MMKAIDCWCRREPPVAVITIPGRRKGAVIIILSLESGPLVKSLIAQRPNKI